MDKAIVIAELSKVGFYATSLSSEIVKDPFDPAKMVDGFFKAQTDLLSAMQELLTDSTMVTPEGQKLQQLVAGLSYAVSNVPEWEITVSIPSTDNTEYFLGGSGQETVPQSVIVKSSTWNLYKAGGRLYLSEYGVARTYRFGMVVNKFFVSPALSLGGTLNTNRFWLWYTDVSNNLTLLEMEPFSGADPVIQVTKSIAANILNMSIHVQENEPIRILTLYFY
jgi:hypothetical protein